MISCELCKKTFSRMQSLNRHNASKMHKTRSSPTVKKYTCECGKYYLHQQSLRNHKISCSFAEPVIPLPTQIPTHTVDQLIIIRLQQDIDSLKKELQKEQEIKLAYEGKHAIIQQKIDVYKKERREMKDKIAVLQHQAAEKCEIDSDISITHQKSRDKRKKISKVVRQQIAEKQQNTCGECKQLLSIHFQLDHVIALQFGGTDEESNLMALCCECHNIKSISENQHRKPIQDFIRTLTRVKRNIDRTVE